MLGIQLPKKGMQNNDSIASLLTKNNTFLPVDAILYPKDKPVKNANDSSMIADRRKSKKNKN